MNPALRIGALGCSSIARRRTLPALCAAETADLAAVAARSPDRAKRFAAEFGAVPMSYGELVGGSGVDAVYVSLPTALHYEWTKRALLAGKHVLCEKPLTTSAPHTAELTALAAERGLVLRENFTFPHHPQHARVRDLLDQGRLGVLRTFTASFGIPPLPAGDIRYDHRLGGGALLDVGVYPLRAARFLLGGDLSVAGAALRIDGGKGVDVAGHALLTTGGGAFASLDFGFEHSYRSRYRLWGSSASLALDRAFTPPPTWQPVLRIDEQDHAEEIRAAPADQFARAVDSFARAALSGAEPAVEAAWNESAEGTARLVEEIRAAAVRTTHDPAVEA